MNIGSICRRRIVTIDAGCSLVQAAGLMREKHVGSLVVTSGGAEGAKVVGVITDRDLVIDVLARGIDAGRVSVGDSASRRLASVSEDDDLSAAIALMRDSGVRRLLVVDAERRLTGIVSLDDLLDGCAQLFTGLADVIRSGIEREAAATANAPKTAPAPVIVPAVGTLGWGEAPL